MNRILTISSVVCALAMAGAVGAQAAEKAPAKKQASKAVKQSAPAPLTEGQLEVAKRVHTGKAECEFNQSVSVDPIAQRPGAFKVSFKNASYTMVPEETTTGAVRLEDKAKGVVWLQIANKSMMMNQKLGQRVVDNCMHPEQRAVADALKASKS